MVRHTLPALLLVAVAATAQDLPKKRPLTHADYDIWNSVAGTTTDTRGTRVNYDVIVSPNGNYVAYLVSATNADGRFVLKNVASGAEFSVPVGSRGGAVGGGGGGPPAGGESAETEDQVSAPAAGVTLNGVPAFTPDSKYVYFPLTPTKADTDRARSDKKALPRPVLAAMDVATGQVVQRIEKVRNFTVVGEGAGVLITVKEPRAETTPTPEKKPDEGADAEDQRGTRQPGGGGGGFPGGGPRPTFGTDLGVKNLADGKEVTFADVQDFSVTTDTKNLLYTVNAKQTDKNGVYYAPLFGPDAAAVVKAGVGRYYRLTWNTDQTRLAFFFDEKPTAPPSPPTPDPANPQPPPPPDADTLSRKPRVYLWDRPTPTQVAAATAPMAAGLSPMAVVMTANKVAPAVEVLGPGTAGLKKGWQIVDRGGLSFTADGKKLVVNAAPEPAPAPAAANTPREGQVVSPPASPTTPTEPTRSGTPPTQPPAATPAPPRGGAAAFDMNLWHWKDEAIQPMQKARANADRTRSYACVYFLDSKEFRHLADEDRAVSVSQHGDWAVGSSDKPYRGQTWRSPNPRDFALVNIRTGDSKPLVKELGATVSASPNSKAVAWFDGKDWFAAAVPDGKPVNLTAKLPVKFFNEEFDMPMTPAAYGAVGWSSDDKFLFVSDRFDIWRLAADGSGATNVTEIGRGLGVRLRLVRVEKPDDKEEEPTPEPAPGTPPAGPPGAGNRPERNDRGLDAGKPWLLSAENLSTRDTGFYRLPPGGKPQLLVMGARKYGTPTKAKKGDAHVLTIQTFKDCPDYYATGPDFREIKRLTDLNPRVKEFNWGTAELVPFRSTDGQPLQAILVKPENFDPAKKYPLIVYIYERLTDGLHTFRQPTVTRGQVINPTYYASNGYLVLMPDIAYRTGQPGQSAVKCVLPAIQAVVDRGCVDEKAIGINGQSWGGYQIAYLVTQTDRFKAAVAGAPVSNMVSAYNGIRWGTGLPRQFQYEHTQSRIGGTLWEMPLKYLENSPVFMADRVVTPLMMIHNDADDAVPWYQGVEYFLALRRLGKEAYLLNYNGQPHNLTNRAAARDFAVRMQQFFDHHLKGAPIPEWMAKGVPYADREKEKEQWKGLFKPEGK